ncbi:MAG: LysE family translocator [Pseudomonadota bacterium]|nr:LysE family translocator [Pseudomonadota bacterium]
MELSALVIFAGALFVAAGSPGPSVAALVAQVLSHGARSVLPFLAAMWIGEAIWLSLAVFGLAYVAQAFQPVFAVLKYCGVAYLLYLAYRMWTAPTRVREEHLPGAGSSWRLFLTGMAITLGNPKIMVFYLALLPSIVDLAHISLIGWAWLTATMMLVLVTVDLAWALLAAYARRWFRSPRAMRIANRAGATALGGAAAAIATQ